MPFAGKIALKRPNVEIGVFEEYPFDWRASEEAWRLEMNGKEASAPEPAVEKGAKMRAVWMGRKVRFPLHFLLPTLRIHRFRIQICDTQRHLIDVYDLKKRAYIGTTSMESEASLLMANQALAAPGKWVYDPFVGTGSMLYTAAGFGALTLGSDIDGRQIRGKSAFTRSFFLLRSTLILLRPSTRREEHLALGSAVRRDEPNR
jgi:tRNA (guanine10-N2)-methyltransferase